MSDPKRLFIDADEGSLERSLLDAWTADGPSQAAREKTLAALGLATAGSVVGTTAASASIAPKAVLATAGLMKWFGLLILALGLSAGVFVFLKRDRVAQPLISISAPTTSAIAPSAAPSTTVVTMNLDSLPQDVPTATPSARVHSAHPAPRPADSSLSPQIALLDRARAALAAGDASRAENLAERYEGDFPNGAFTQEAEVLRVEALIGEGRRDDATTVGKHFLDAHPTSPHAPHLREILGL